MTDPQADLTERAREVAKDIRVELMGMAFINARDELLLPAGHLAIMEKHITAALQSEREAAAAEIAALTEQRDRAMKVVEAFRRYANSTKGQDLDAEAAMYAALATLDAEAAAKKRT